MMVAAGIVLVIVGCSCRGLAVLVQQMRGCGAFLAAVSVVVVVICVPVAFPMLIMATEAARLTKYK